MPFVLLFVTLLPLIMRPHFCGFKTVHMSHWWSPLAGLLIVIRKDMEINCMFSIKIIIHNLKRNCHDEKLIPYPVQLLWHVDSRHYSRLLDLSIPHNILLIPTTNSILYSRRTIDSIQQTLIPFERTSIPYNRMSIPYDGTLIPYSWTLIHTDRLSVPYNNLSSLEASKPARPLPSKEHVLVILLPLLTTSTLQNQSGCSTRRLRMSRRILQSTSMTTKTWTSSSSTATKTSACVTTDTSSTTGLSANSRNWTNTRSGSTTCATSSAHACPSCCTKECIATMNYQWMYCKLWKLKEGDQIKKWAHQFSKVYLMRNLIPIYSK